MSKILFVDDDQGVSDFMVRTLRALGHEVVLAQDGQAALTALENFAPEIVITDLLMPDMDGIELIAELRRQRISVRIIAISAGGFHSAHTYLETAQQFGADAILAKPFSMSELTAALNSLIVR